MPLFRSPPPAVLPAEEDNPYLLSFSDLMAGLLAIFILALITLMIRLDQQASLAQDTRKQVQAALAELAHIEELRRELLEELKQQLAAGHIHVEISDNHAVLRIPDDQLHFESGKYEIPPDKREAVNTLGRVLAEALARSPHLNYLETIFIEGHTDSQPWAASEMGNWGLSAYRAIAVWKYWTESPGELKNLSALLNREDRPLFSVSGYADTRRLLQDDLTPEARRQNRRIDLRFTLRAPVTGDLTRLLEQFKQAGIE